MQPATPVARCLRHWSIAEVLLEPVRQRRSVVGTVRCIGIADAKRVVASDNQGCGDSLPAGVGLPLRLRYCRPGVAALGDYAVFGKLGSGCGPLDGLDVDVVESKLRQRDRSRRPGPVKEFDSERFSAMVSTRPTSSGGDRAVGKIRQVVVERKV
jgi:hypothetical protein